MAVGGATFVPVGVSILVDPRYRFDKESGGMPIHWHSTCTGLSTCLVWRLGLVFTIID